MSNSDTHSSAGSDGLPERLRQHVVDDHVRGCTGRQYSCTCGYDVATDGLLEEASDEIVRLSGAPAQAERVWHRKDCPFCGSPDGQYSASLQDLPAAFFCKGCGINAAQPPAAPVETCKTCNGRREVGGFDRGDNAYRSEPCPECSPQRSSAGTASEHHAPEVFLFYRDKQLHHIHTDRKVFETWMEKSAWNYPADRCEIVRYVPDVPQPVPLTQQDVADVIAWAKEHDLPVPLALFAHFKMSRGSSPLPRPHGGGK